MVISRHINNGTIGFNEFLRGVSVGTGTAGAVVKYSSTLTDATADFGVLGVLQGDLLTVNGERGASYRITRGDNSLGTVAVDSLQMVSDSMLTLQDQDNPISGADRTPIAVIGDDSSTGAIIPAAAGITAASGVAGNLCRLVNVEGFSKVTVQISVQDNSSSAVSFYIAPRFSSKKYPVVATPGDWALEVTESVTTGVGTLDTYHVVGDVSVTHMISVTFPVRGTYFAPLVWASAAQLDEASVLVIRGH